MPRRMINDIIAGRRAVTAGPDVTVRAASRLMVDNRIGALLVTQGGRITGIFTERDALNKVLAGGLDPDATTLDAVMVADPQTITGDRPLAHALHMMVEGGFRHVPVVDAQGNPVGMVSARDALGEEIADLERNLRLRDDIEGSIGY
jgi:CBS domain-containing protein